MHYKESRFRKILVIELNDYITSPLRKAKSQKSNGFTMSQITETKNISGLLNLYSHVMNSSTFANVEVSISERCLPQIFDSHLNEARTLEFREILNMIKCIAKFNSHTPGPILSILSSTLISKFYLIDISMKVTTHTRKNY